MDYQELVQELVKRGHLKTKRIIEAFKKIDRADFLPEQLKGEAWLDAPLPIGHGQTISQPFTVGFMLELLQPRPGDKILDIGSGSGWTTALLASIVGAEGKVFGVERILELCEFGKNNAAKYNFVEKGIASFFCADGSVGLKKEVPFDKILAGAACEEIPQFWRKQLKIGGRLVTPVKNSIWLLIKKQDDKFEEKEFSGFAFVPLVVEK